MGEHVAGERERYSNLEQEIRLFVPQPESRDRNTAPPLIRRFRHDFGEDNRKRIAKEPLLWPAIAVEYFRMTRAGLDELDRHVRAIDGVSSSLSVESDSVSVWWFYGRQEEAERQALSDEGRVSTIYQERWVDLQSDPKVSLRFSSDGDAFAAAWQATWDYLMSVCIPSNQLDKCIEHYKIPPEDYARLLASCDPDVTSFV